MAKKRLDVALFEMGLAQSRERAKALIMSGICFVNNQRADKAGDMVSDTDHIEVRGKDMPYVSRGGYKLEKAIELYGIDLKDKVAMDVGASTGGFTDCMLQNGAQLVYAVDVGYGQLAWELRQSPKVISMERTNIRYLEKEKLTETPNFISIDVSFISLKLVLPRVVELSSDDAEIVCLIKPQFEAGREKIGKGGVVKDKNVHIDVISQFLVYANENNCGIINITFSPIKGPKGNIEFLGYLKKNQASNQIDIHSIVEDAHKTLEDSHKTPEE